MRLGRGAEQSSSGLHPHRSAPCLGAATERQARIFVQDAMIHRWLGCPHRHASGCGGGGGLLLRLTRRRRCLPRGPLGQVQLPRPRQPRRAPHHQCCQPCISRREPRARLPEAAEHPGVPQVPRVLCPLPQPLRPRLHWGGPAGRGVWAGQRSPTLAGAAVPARHTAGRVPLTGEQTPNAIFTPAPCLAWPLPSPAPTLLRVLRAPLSCAPALPAPRHSPGTCARSKKKAQGSKQGGGEERSARCKVHECPLLCCVCSLGCPSDQRWHFYAAGAKPKGTGLRKGPPAFSGQQAQLPPPSHPRIPPCCHALTPRPCASTTRQTCAQSPLQHPARQTATALHPRRRRQRQAWCSHRPAAGRARCCRAVQQPCAGRASLPGWQPRLARLLAARLAAPSRLDAGCPARSAAGCC